MRFLIFALLAAGSMALAISEEEYQYQFAKYQVTYNKTYSRAEFSQRYQVFKTNYDLITSHNLEKHAWTLAVNEYADMSWEEFKAQKLGYKKIVTTLPRETVNPAGLFTAPASVDWTTKGAVTAVKNQGQCGSCWAFSTTGSTEGAWFLTKGQLVSLSEQNLVDCSGAEGNQGCNGGLMDDGFQYIIDKKGIDSEKSYPYTAEDGSCKFKTANVVATISSFTDVASGDENALQSAVAQQPVSVAIDASQSSFQFYSSGVYYDENCSSDQLDHGVLAVGYGTDGGQDYWLVKNSWAASWGDQGYIKMSRNRDNNCGIATAASYPVV